MSEVALNAGGRTSTVMWLPRHTSDMLTRASSWRQRVLYSAIIKLPLNQRWLPSDAHSNGQRCKLYLHCTFSPVALRIHTVPVTNSWRLWGENPRTSRVGWHSWLATRRSWVWNLGSKTGCESRKVFFMVFFTPYMQLFASCLQTDHGSFITPFQFIIHYHPRTWLSLTRTVENSLLNEQTNSIAVWVDPELVSAL